MKNTIDKLTAKELEILLILWNFDGATVRTINDEQNKVDDVGYTTTLKLMQLMVEKGILERVSKGRGHVYYSNIPEKDMQDFIFKKYTQTTSGRSAMKLVLKALGNQEGNTDELLEIKDFFKKL